MSWLFFGMWMVSHCNRSPGESPSLETCKSGLDEALSSLVQLWALLKAGGWTMWPPEVLFDLNCCFSFIKRWELCKVSKIISCFWLDTPIAFYVSKLQRLLVSLDTACLAVTEHFGLSEVITVLKAGEDVTSANSTAWCQHKTPTATREAPLKKAARVNAV